MDHSQSRSYAAALSRPPQDAMPMIPPGRFIDIDQKFYSPQPRMPEVHTGFASQGKPITPYSVSYGKSGDFVPYEAPIGGTNYGSYIYNPQPNVPGGGTDATNYPMFK